MDKERFFKEFEKNFEKKARTLYPEHYKEYDFVYSDVPKNNQVKRSVSVVSKAKNRMNLSPVFYLDDCYDEYLRCKNITSILEEMAKIMVTSLNYKPFESKFDYSKLGDLNAVKPYIYPKLVCMEGSGKYLENHPYFDHIEGIAVCFAINVKEMFGLEEESVSCSITNNLLENYGITKEELMNIAVNNTDNVDVTIKNIMDYVPVCMFSELEDIEKYQMNVVTSSIGAGFLVSLPALIKISKTMGGDFYIIPSSTEELIVVPASDLIDEDVLRDIIVQVNASEVPAAIKLADHLYRYDSNFGIVSKVK